MYNGMVKFMPDLSEPREFNGVHFRSNSLLRTFFFIFVLSKDFNCGQSGIISAKLPERELLGLCSHAPTVGFFPLVVHFNVTALAVTLA